MTQNEVRLVIEKLSVLYPEAGPELVFSNPFETLISTMLSAQCTDKRVNMVTARLFREHPDAASMSALSYAELEDKIRECGLYRMKAQHIVDTCKVLCEKYFGEVPRGRSELEALPGVGHKTAGVVRMAAFGEDEIPVDTHVFRLANRIGLVDNTSNPDETERELRKVIPEGERGRVHHLLIWHGRRCCTARKPECARCPLSDGLCRYTEDK